MSLRVASLPALSLSMAILPALFLRMATLTPPNSHPLISPLYGCVGDAAQAWQAQAEETARQLADTIARLEREKRESAARTLPTRDPRVRPALPKATPASPSNSRRANAQSTAKPTAAKQSPAQPPKTPRCSQSSKDAKPPRASPNPPRASPTPPHPSPNPNSSGSSAKGAGGSAKSTSSNSASSSKAKPGNNKETKSRKPAEHQMFKDDIDPKAKKFKETFQMHLRFISSCLDSTTAPPTASEEAVKHFELRFEGLTVADLKRQGRVGQLFIQPSQVKFGLSVPDAVKSNSKILRGFCQVEESAILHVKTYFAKLRLATWAIDYTQTPYSMYNQAMRMAAIDTFRFLMGVSAYDFLRPDTSYVKDTTLLVRIYDHFIHHYMFEKWKVEVRMPGGNQLTAQRNKYSQARTRLYKSRENFLNNKKITKRLRGMFNPKATSDAETTPKGPVALAREERSECANRLVRKVDALIVQELLDNGNICSANLRKARCVPPFGQRDAGQFHEVPKAMPIQYYAPDWFNDRPPQARAKIAPKLIVAFPPDCIDFFSRCGGDIHLSVEELTAKYGAAVFTDYDFDFGPADAEASNEGADADDEGEGDSVGSQDSDEEGESSNTASVASFLDDTDADQDDAMYDEDDYDKDVELEDAQDGDEGITDDNQAHFAAELDVDMQEIFGSGGDESE
ncbi:hypothetical protein B0H13DRAFT_2370469 [Mycena leptocephala]|nr:hypothetical protein B0H13DRAFT_2370469 [Mycena leptocephala]